MNEKEDVEWSVKAGTTRLTSGARITSRLQSVNIRSRTPPCTIGTTTRCSSTSSTTTTSTPSASTTNDTTSWTKWRTLFPLDFHCRVEQSCEKETNQREYSLEKVREDT